MAATSTQLLSPSKSIDAIRLAHQELMDRLTKNTAVLMEGSSARQDWLLDANEFLQSVQASVISLRKDGEPADLEWLARVASEWQLTMSGKMNLPMDVRKEIGLEPEMDRTPETKIVVTPKATWTRARVEQRLQCESFFIGSNRKILAVLRRYRQLQRMKAQRIHAEIPSTDQERWQDWYDSCRFLALDVILGRVDFARLIDPSAYEFLDTVWLDDIKQLDGYLRWEQSNAECAFLPETDFYYPACSEIEQRLFGGSADVSCDSLVQWWKEQYLTGKEHSPADPQAMDHVIARKARRIWEKTGRDSDKANWTAAKQYVDAFYGHLLSAVQEKDRAAIKCIHDALVSSCNRQHGCELVTGLEAAIASSFIDFSCLKPRPNPAKTNGH